jgi:hypothetical protein
VASSESLDVRYRVMRHALYRRICMAIKIASNLLLFFVVVNFIVGHNERLSPCYGQYKLKLRQIVIH